MVTLISLSRNRGRLRPDAAASVSRIDKQRAAQGLPPLSINSAFRSYAEQEVLIRRWRAGGKYNRPPYLYQPDMTPPYEHGKGTVLDTNDQKWMLTYGKTHGWRRPFFYDKPHFEYYPHLDLRRPSDPDATRQVFRLEGSRPARYYLVGKGKRWNTRIYQLAKRWIKRYGYGGIEPLDKILAAEAALKAKWGL